MIISAGTSLRTFGAEETRAAGYCLGGLLIPGDVVLLTGELGSGKTTFVQGVLTGRFGEGIYQSPTFTLVNAYPEHFFHLDLYRLRDASELHDLGEDEFFGPDAVALVEWGERAAELMPGDRLEIRFAGEDVEREITFQALGPRSRELLASFFSRLPSC